MPDQARQDERREPLGFLSQFINTHPCETADEHSFFRNTVANQTERVTCQGRGQRERMARNRCRTQRIQQERQQGIAPRQRAVEIEYRHDRLFRLRCAHNFIRLKMGSGMCLMISMM